MSKNREHIETLRQLNNDQSPIIKNDCIKFTKQVLKEDLIIPENYNGITVGLKVPDNVKLFIPDSVVLVSL